MAKAFGFSVCVALTLALGASVPVRAADGAGIVGSTIPRFSQVGERLYRGGQPGDEDFAYLRSLGIRTIVSLREDDRERSRVESLGMKFVHIPVTFTAFAPTTRIPQQAVEKFFQVLDDPASGPVFLHCRRGADRTGAFVGLYRMLRENWTAQRAYEEARRIGMRWWYFGVKDQLEKMASALSIVKANASVGDGKSAVAGADASALPVQ